MVEDFVLFIDVSLFGLVLEDCVTQHSHPDIHGFDLCEHNSVSIFNLDNWGRISHVTGMLVGFGENEF